MFRRFFVVSLLLAAVSACGANMSDPRPDVARSYELTGLNFAAAPDLTVSEAANYYPVADVVWRGDPVGDRIAQIGSMFTEAAARNTGNLGGTQPIVVDVVLDRFHGVTERTQYTIGGVYNIAFRMTIRDARTGAIIEPERRVVFNLDAPGGQQAIELDRAGQTQRIRVTDFLASSLRAELL